MLRLLNAVRGIVKSHDTHIRLCLLFKGVISLTEWKLNEWRKNVQRKGCVVCSDATLGLTFGVEKQRIERKLMVEKKCLFDVCFC